RITKQTKKGLRNFRNQHTNALCFLASEASGQSARLVVESHHGLSNLVLQSRGHVTALVDHPRNRCGRHPSERGNFLHRGHVLIRVTSTFSVTRDSPSNGRAPVRWRSPGSSWHPRWPQSGAG